MRSDLFSEDILEFIKLLNKHDVKYVIVGGIAVIYHGYSRGTGDVDFFYENTDENVRRLYETLKEFWNGDIPSLDNPSNLQKENTIIQFGRPPNRIDLINEIDGVTFGEVWSESMEETIDSDSPISVKLINIDQLLKNKRASDRPKDEQDLRYLMDQE
jgi:predicted nucleotidyltransferase